MSDAFTIEDVMRAVKALEERNIPPMACQKCGTKFYVAFPPGCTETIEDVVQLCDECFAEWKGW